jgi:hypothetical protein
VRIQVFIGTRKGAFIASSHGDRKEWSLAGPIFKGWEVTAVDRLADGTWLVGTTSYVYGPAIHRSRDLDRWEQVVDGPAFSPDLGRTLKSIWTLTSGHGQVWAGVDEAALFRSSDQGRSWLPVPGLNDHPSRDGWQPGAGGLCAHAVLLDPEDEGQIWCGISAVGVFHSQDSGKSWTPANRGVTQIIESPGHPGIGYCVHGLAQDVSDPQRIWRQDHTGMYRSSDGGRDWERAEGGLPRGSAFPLPGIPILDDSSSSRWRVMSTGFLWRVVSGLRERRRWGDMGASGGWAPPDAPLSRCAAGRDGHRWAGPVRSLSGHNRWYGAPLLRWW